MEFQLSFGSNKMQNLLACNRKKSIEDGFFYQYP